MDKRKELKFEVTPKGSLGLLAYGDVGLREWRKVRKSSSKEKNSEEKEE